MPRAISGTIAFTPPMECQLAEYLPEGNEWVYELKLDGYRAQCIRDVRGVHLFSKNGSDLSRKFPSIVKAAEQALMDQTVVDGELVAFDERGQPSFNAMQNAGPQTNVVFFVFDILLERGRDATRLPLIERRGLLETHVIFSHLIQYSEQFSGSLEDFIAGVQKIGGEGVVAKRLGSRYEAGKRTGAWKKKRIATGQEFVIGGFTRGAHGMDAVIVGYYKRSHLIYVARVRAGFVPATRRTVYSQLERLITNVCPFSGLPEQGAGRWGEGLTAEKMKECVWVNPTLVANFEFLEWTDTNHVRHIKFVGMRNDKNPRKVVRER